MRKSVSFCACAGVLVAVLSLAAAPLGAASAPWPVRISDTLAQHSQQQSSGQSQTGDDASAALAKPINTPQELMKSCMDSWDAFTQMTKREWRDACQRTVVEWPDVYGSPL